MDTADAADRAAHAGGEPGLQIDDDVGGVVRIVERGSAAAGNVAAQRRSVGEHETVAARAGCQVADLAKLDAAPVGAAQQRARVFSRAEVKNIARIGAGERVARTAASNIAVIGPPPADIGKGLARVVQAPVGTARTSKCSTSSQALRLVEQPDTLLKFPLRADSPRSH